MTRIAPSFEAMGLTVQRPEPGRFWIRYAPRGWTGPEGPWLNLARGTLEPGRKGPVEAGMEELASAPVDDVLYLPPVSAPEDREARERLLRDRLALQGPTVVQLLPGEELDKKGAPIVAVTDLTSPLLVGDLKALDSVAPGGYAVWPLIPGVTDDPDLWEEGCRRLAATGVRGVQPLAVVLRASQRRELAEGLGESRFEALFHGPPPDEGPFVRVAHRWQLQIWIPRPLPPGRLGKNRALAGHLAMMGEIWIRLGRPPGRGQEFFRAARRIDESRHPITAMAREGNLDLLDWLEPPVRQVVEEWAKDGTSPLLQDLLEEYLSPEEPR